MIPDLLILKNCRAGLSTLCLALLVVATCLAGGRALAQDTYTNDQPAVVNAVAESDAEVNNWLKNASAALRGGAPDVALPWIVRLLQADPALMASTNGVNFRPARKLAADLLRALPERTLAIYRLQAAGATRRVAGGAPPTDMAALDAQYRMALPGAPAAAAGLRLAGLYLDQERFREARSVLRDVLDDAPANFAPRSELLARLVVACARVGDAVQAAWAWDELQKRPDTERWAALGAELRPEAAPASNAWTMAYGGPSRPGVATGTSPDLEEDAGATLRWGLNTGAGMIGSGAGVVAGVAIDILSRGNAVAQVTRKGRRPADDVIFAGNRAWVNGFGEFIVVDLATGCAIGRTAHVTDPIQRGTRVLSAGLVFGNRLNRAASLIGEHAYCVEDNFRATLARGRMAPAGQPAGNALAAYAADTGRLLWRIGRDVTPQAPEKGPRRWRANAICFVGAPVACGGVLVAPIEDVYGFGAVGLDAETGAPLWRTRLAAYPQVLLERFAPAPLTVDGANAYVCSGRGSVSLLDGCDGSVRWTTLYPTFADIDSTNRVGADGMPDMWEECVVLVAGEAAVVLPEDAPDIMACDRRSGVRLWTRRKPAGVDYVVGRRGTTLIVAGVRAVVGVDLADGRERWRTPIAGSTGRGALCGQDVLIPSGRTLLRLGAEDGKPAEPVRAQTMEDLPLGNLYVNGDQLLVAGLERLYALGDARTVFARLAERLAKEPTAAEAYYERSRLYAGLGRYAEALADLSEAWKRQRGSADEEAARAQLLAEFGSATAQDPGAAEALYVGAVGGMTDRAQSTWRRAQRREQGGDTNGALTLYTRLMAEPDASISPSLDDPNWEASASRLAARRVRALLADDEAKVRALLEEPASNALSRLGPQADAMALSDVATVFAGTSAARDAAFRAAQLAVGRGDMGIAEAILQRALALSAPSDREAMAAELVRLYERTRWPNGAATLCRQWRNGGKGPVPEFLERAARVDADANAFQFPPWRPRWRKTLPVYSSVRLAPAGLCYSKLGPKTVLGCLDLTTGEPKWQKEVVGNVWMFSGVAGPRDDSSFVMIQGGKTDSLAADSLACVDLWSGSVFPEVIRATTLEWSGFQKSRVGLATHVTREQGGRATSVDLLTGRGAWKRAECETLPGLESIPQLIFASAEGVWLSGASSGGSSSVVMLDPWTGAVVDSTTLTANAARTLFADIRNPAMQSKVGARMRGACVVPEFNDQRLSGRNLRTGATVWTTPPDMAIAKQQSLPGGAILAQTTDEELLLLDGDTGAVRCRSKDIRFPFRFGNEVDNTVVAYGPYTGQFQNGTNEVLVIDSAANAITFRGKLSARGPREMYPLRSLGAAMPDRLLVQVSAKNGTVNQSWIQVIDGQGELVNDWRLPPGGELGTADRRFQPVFAGGLLLMVDAGTGSVLAYEHDQGEGARK